MYNLINSNKGSFSDLDDNINLGEMRTEIQEKVLDISDLMHRVTLHFYD